MLNLSEYTINYIAVTFQPEVKSIIYNGFSLLEAFGLKFYEDKFIDLIQREDTITSDTKKDMFILLLEEDLKSIISEHKIYLNSDINVSLNELNEIVNFLFIIQKLEDYTLISYRLYAEDKNRYILIDIIDYLTLLSKPRLLEIISDVDDIFIESLKIFIDDKNISDEDILNNKHTIYINDFFTFIEKTECLGLELYNKGYLNITLNELINLINFDITEHIDKNILLNPEHSALDTLSILIICKDSYELPLLKFKQFNSLFTNKLENVTKLEFIMLNIINDFNMYLEAKKQEEKLNVN